MDLDLTRSIGLGLTTAFVGTYTIYQQSIRQRSASIKEKKRNDDGSDNDSITRESTYDSLNLESTDYRTNSLPQPELNSERITTETINNAYPYPPPPPSPTAMQLETARSPLSLAIFELTSDVGDSSEAETEHPSHTTSEVHNAHNIGSIDASLYNELRHENEELRRKINDITNSQEREMNLLLPATPNGTRWSTHSLLEEVTRLRTELSVCTQAYNAAQDQLFSTQQQMYDEQKKLQTLTNMIIGNQGASHQNASLEEVIVAVKELNEYIHKAKLFEENCQSLETSAIDSAAKILELREQLNSFKLTKVQEVTELRKQLATGEAHYHRELELQSRIHKLESQLIDTTMQMNSSPVREELEYSHNRSPVRDYNPSFEDLTQIATAGVQYSRPPATTTPSKQRPSSDRSKKNATPKRHGSNPSDAADFTATVPPPLIPSSTLLAALNNSNCGSGSVLDTPTSTRPHSLISASRVRSSSTSKLKAAHANASTTPPSHLRLNSRLTNYTNASGNKSVSTQEFLRMLNDPSGSNGGL
jgi:hypothetical protein